MFHGSWQDGQGVPTAFVGPLKPVIPFGDPADLHDLPQPARIGVKGTHPIQSAGPHRKLIPVTMAPENRPEQACGAMHRRLKSRSRMWPGGQFLTLDLGRVADPMAQHHEEEEGHGQQGEDGADFCED